MRRLETKLFGTRKAAPQTVGLIAVGIMAVSGVYFILQSSAATPLVSTEPETGMITAPAKATDSSDSSAGRHITFATASTPPPGQSPSGVPMPSGDVTSGGHTWKRIFAEDFTKNAPLGSWGSDCDASKVLYTGEGGTRWKAYPKCYVDTYHDRPYRSDAVLSVHDGVLDFWLHPVDGRPAGANPAPILPNGTSYQTYGRYEVRFKTTTTNMPEYYTAWLLWPQDESNWDCAESDYPEGRLNKTSTSAFAHYCRDDGSATQNAYSAPVDFTQWHTYTQEWMPGKRNYYLDGKLIGSSTTNVWSGPQRWQLQTETNSTCDTTTPITCSAGGNLLLDWAVVWAY